MRNLDPTLLAAMESGFIMPVFFAMLTFRTSTRYVWTGAGSISFNGQTYLGIGSLGQVGGVNEGVQVKAEGTSVTLSGIDPALLNECMTDIQLGAPATLWFGLMTNTRLLIGTPYKLFSGSIDKPTVSVGAATISITLNLESRLIDLSRPSNFRYTTADQHIAYPNDSAFTWVEILNDQALIWGS